MRSLCLDPVILNKFYNLDNKLLCELWPGLELKEKRTSVLGQNSKH